MAFLKVAGLTYTYPPLNASEAGSVALNYLTFDLEAGKFLAVTGPNGCGKTTLCQAVAGLAPRLTQGKLSGQILVAGQDVQLEAPGALADQIGFVLQDPAGQLFNISVEQEIAWGLENLGVLVEEIRERIAWALELVNLADVPHEQPPSQLSGGQQKRLALAAALALRPQLLILDEPAGGLSPRGKAEMVAVLRKLRQQQSLTMLFTETDPEVIAALADDVMLLDSNGNFVTRQETHAFYHWLGTQPINGVSQPAAGEFSNVIRLHGWSDFKAITTGETIAQVRQLNTNHSTPITHSGFDTVQFNAGSPAITIQDLTSGYDPLRPVLHNIDLGIPHGQFTVLMGENGAGKTTLARHLIGLLRPQSGNIQVNGEAISTQTTSSLARQIGFAFQNPELQIFNATVRDEIAFGPRNLGLESTELAEAVGAALEQFDLIRLADVPPAALSFSVRRLIALASIAAMQTPIIILDEPTVGLDAAHSRLAMDWLQSRHEQGATILLITHDTEIAAAYGERIVVLCAGRVLADGLPRHVFAQREVLQQAGLTQPFAVEFAQALKLPLPPQLTPFATAQQWLDNINGGQ